MGQRYHSRCRRVGFCHSSPARPPRNQPRAPPDALTPESQATIQPLRLWAPSRGPFSATEIFTASHSQKTRAPLPAKTPRQTEASFLHEIASYERPDKASSPLSTDASPFDLGVCIRQPLSQARRIPQTLITGNFTQKEKPLPTVATSRPRLRRLRSCGRA